MPFKIILLYNLWFNKFILVLILYCFGIIMNTYFD